MKKKFKNYYLKEFEFYDGEANLIFSIVDIDFTKEEITVALTNRGRISVISYDLIENENGYYFEYGLYFEKIYISDFEEVI